MKILHYPSKPIIRKRKGNLKQYQKSNHAFSARFAGQNIRIRPLFAETKTFCKDYLINDDEKVILTVTISPKDIRYEREKSKAGDLAEHRKPVEYKAAYLETLAVYRKIADGLIDHHVFLIHGSALMLDNTSGFLFAGRSGAGKSTHAGFWRKVFGDRVTMINDDKPLLQFEDDTFFVCGTPWDGKHHLSSNAKAPLKGICFIKQGPVNVIQKLPFNQAFAGVLQQIYRPKDPKLTAKTLEMINALVKRIPVFELTCKAEEAAAETAYQTMVK